MYPIPFFFFLLQILHVSAQSPPPPLRNGNLVGNFEPSLAVVTGVLAIMFTLTFVLLIYAKCFRIDLTSGHGSLMMGGGRRRFDRRRQGIFFNRSTDSSNRFSGLDKSAIESLPLFRFSSLKGLKQGLECSVCLSKFEDIEILRLLPKCRHAFHIGCIDQWLEQHATCPLCRDLVSVEEELGLGIGLGIGLGFGNSFRVLNQSEVREDISLELYIEREEEEQRRQRDEIGAGSLRFNIGESFRKILKLGFKEKSLLVGQETKVMSKFNHRILVSDVMFKSRWSNVSSSDFMVLNSEMVNSISSERFTSSDREKSGENADRRGNLQSKKEFEENKDSRSLMIECGRRSISEITGVPRVSVLDVRENATAFGNRTTEAAETEERRRRLWLPIARKTAQWFVNRERRDEVNITQQHFNV